MSELNRIIGEEYDRIEESAVLKRLKVCYIAGLVQRNYSRLVEVAGSDDERMLFDIVNNAVERLQEYPTLGIVYNSKNLGEIEFLLGWAKSNKQNMGAFHYYTLGLTESGSKILNDLKEFDL